MIKYSKFFMCTLLAVFFINCETDDAIETELSDYVGFEIMNPMKVDVGNDDSESYEVNVYASEVSSSDRTYGLSVDDESSLEAEYNVPDSVTIPAGSNNGSFVVTVTDNDDLQFVSQSLIINFEKEEGVDFSDAMLFNITERCLNTIATFNLTLDTWPDETTWELFDLSGTPVVIASGGPYVNPDDDFAEFSFDFCLASGDYGIAVYDSYGDGIADGGYTIVVNDDVIVSGIVAGATAASEFTID